MKKIHFVMLFSLITLCSCPSPPKEQVKRNYAHQNQDNKKENINIKQKTNNEQIGDHKHTKMSSTDIFEQYNSAVFMIFTSDGWSDYQGSGFFVDPTGIGVSNYHVFNNTYKGLEQIKLVNGDIYRIEKVIAYDNDDDFIVFKVSANGKKFDYIPIANISPKVGEKVYAIGSPRGLENTFSSGEVSQLREDNWIQISVPIDHGSSGGVLINEYGEAVGITSAGMDNSGANLNFAKSIKVVKQHIK